MLFGVLSGVPDVITHAKFCVNRLMGFSVATPPKVPFPILFRTTLTTVLHYRADCESYMSFRLVLKSVTLSDFEWRNNRYIALFQRIGYLKPAFQLISPSSY